MSRHAETALRATCKHRLQVQSTGWHFAPIGKLRADVSERLALEQVERKLEDKGRGKKK
jgi:hypothetical protein